MARVTSLIKVEGTLDGVSFYKGKNGHYAKMAKGPSKERIANDPAFVRTRENNTEFGGSAAISKGLRVGLAIVFNDVSDSSTNARLVKVVKAVISKDDAGIRGQRTFYPVLYKQVLEGFEFNELSSLYSRFSAPFDLSSNVARDQVTLTVPDFDAKAYVKPPQGATHFRIICASVLLSSYSIPTGQSQYSPLDPANSSNNISASDYLSVSGMVNALPPIVCAFPAGIAPAVDSAVIGCVGIEFYQQIGTSQYTLAAGNSMRLVRIF